MTLRRVEYIDKVLDILESFHYDEMVAFYHEECVAKTIAATCASCRMNDVSPMMCAIIVWSLTMTEKIIPESKASRVM